jgi:hypothetical protein
MRAIFASAYLFKLAISKVLFSMILSISFYFCVLTFSAFFYDYAIRKTAYIRLYYSITLSMLLFSPNASLTCSRVIRLVGTMVYSLVLALLGAIIDIRLAITINQILFLLGNKHILNEYGYEIGF